MTALLHTAAVLLLFGQAPDADWLRVDAHVSVPGDAGSAVRVGVPFQLTLEAEHSPGNIALLPRELGLPDTLGERAAARQHRRTPGEREDRDVYVLELIAFEAGQLEIPPIPLAMGSTTAASPALVLVVESTLDEDEQLVAASTQAAALAELERMAAVGPAPMPILVADYTLFWVLAVAGLLIGAVLLALRIMDRRRAEAPAGPPPPPPRPAHELAREALAQLRSEDPLGQGDFRGHYTALSMILRRYVGGRYEFESVELTHDELMDALRVRRTPGLNLDRLDEVLFIADQVKFAKFVPLVDDGKAAFKEAEAIVETTAPRPEPEPEAKPEPQPEAES